MRFASEPASRTDHRMKTRLAAAPKARRLALASFMIAAGSLAIAGLPAVAHSKVYHARDEAIALAFPDAERVEARDIVLTDDQKNRIQKLAKAPLDSSLVTLYVGWRAGSPFAYALFDTHTVRTHPETFLVVISPQGSVVASHVCAFHEPEDYLPPRRWLDRFNDRKLDDDLQIGRDVYSITGSTLSARAVTSGIRRALAIWTVVIGSN
jgi:Na+-translocating ferredoxin:NAD+ oxidoreductase RnfG subunit